MIQNSRVCLFYPHICLVVNDNSNLLKMIANYLKITLDNHIRCYNLKFSMHQIKCKTDFLKPSHFVFCLIYLMRIFPESKTKLQYYPFSKD